MDKNRQDVHARYAAVILLYTVVVCLVVTLVAGTIALIGALL